MYNIALILGSTVSPQFRNEFPDVDIYEDVSYTRAEEISKDLIAQHKVDILVSTSGLADYLSKHISIPVVRADASNFDLLEILRFAEEQAANDGKPMALIMHESNSIDMRLFQPYLNSRLCFLSYREEREISDIVNKLVCGGTTVMVGGPAVVKAANNCGARPFLLNVGINILRAAVKQAYQILNFGHDMQKQSQRMKTAFNLFSSGLLVMDDQGYIIECNRYVCKLFNLESDELLGKKIEALLPDPSCQETYKQGVLKTNIITKCAFGSLFSNRTPVMNNGAVQGAVFTIQEAAEIESMEHKYRQMQSQGLTAHYLFNDIIGTSDAIKTTIKKAKAFSDVDSTILIRGETGCGKEVFAQSIHNNSPRHKGPFVAINCAALPENLLESELMGYEEGAFTSAKRGGKKGLFELAHKGTIFFDEINHIPIQMQANILRVIQERQVLRLGGNRIIPIDVRIIVASNEDLLGLVKKMRMRQDLYYRLNVLSVYIPPLRARKEDIRPLVKYYFKLFTDRYGPTVPFGDKALELLMEHSWPGNVRELINCVERYVILSRSLSLLDMDFVSDYILAEHSRHDPSTSDQYSGETKDPNQIMVMLGTLSDMECQLINMVLERCHGNKVKAATILDISRSTLWKRLQDNKSSV